ncbi:DUF4314 domain-containing protein [Bradyrhizobium sp. 179]|uniref:DUF4314 domain-containing protein n=1 Tax=Bradyrhizobium sp. 179 TaxID=2782648 RepID=UPI001FF6FF6F|nr:DUF4314 domain-containing protein [Bradyrhizobium sp. 179]MCK1543359.1 DUF4314 domain-containing protein [Bradyrhizobium sp. 179]
MNKPPALKPRDRIRLIAMGPDPDPVTPGAEGEIVTSPVLVGNEWSVCVKWDDGRTLGLIIPPDRVEKIA